MIGIFGDLGSYKTSLAVAYAYDASLNNIPIYSNFFIGFSGCHKLELSELLSLDVESGLYIVDEVYTVAESRVSSSKLNRFFSCFIFQSRKLGAEVIYTSQLSSAVDLRLFNLTDVKIACFGWNPSDGFVYFKVVVGNHTKNVRVPKWWFEEFVFPYFRTEERVQPLGLADLLVDVEKFDGDRINRRVDEGVEAVLSAWGGLPQRKIMRFEVEDTLLQLGIPQSLSKFVFNRLSVRGLK